MSASETKQDEKSRTYKLSAEEKGLITALVSAATQSKLQVYNLNMQLEQAQRQRDQAESTLQGALILLAQAHKMPGATLSADFSTLEEPQ